MTKKIQTTLFICSIAILLCLPSVFGNVDTYNPSADTHSTHPTQDPHNPTHTKIEDDEEKEMLKELMGDFDNPADHKHEHHVGTTYDHLNQHDINSHDQLVHHDTNTQTHNPQPGHHEDLNNAHNLPKTRNPLHDRVKADPTTDIKELDIKVDGKDHYYNVYSCTYIKIPIHHGNVDVSVACLGNSDKAMLTTTHLKNCSELMQFHCPNHTSFCKTHDLMHETDIKVYHSIADAEEAYLYILPHKISEELSFKVRVSPTPGITIKDAPTVHDVCNSRNMDTCEEHPDVCHSRCMWRPCAYLNENEVNVAGGVCITTGSDQKLAEQRCLTMPDFANAAPEKRVHIELPTCQYTPAPGVAHSHALLAVGIFTVLFMTIVCFYRYQFRKYGSGFFNPPRWCPRCLFPSKQGELTNSFYKDIIKSSELEMDYQPPVL